MTLSGVSRDTLWKIFGYIRDNGMHDYVLESMVPAGFISLSVLHDLQFRRVATYVRHRLLVGTVAYRCFLTPLGETVVKRIMEELQTAADKGVSAH
ncbi:MAG TPA: hypothetical protein VMN56_01310 [Casimicrobiaceae bacterium]|nr:hypothetical protein [Casimicrobiaceae bacterium]